MSILYCNKLYYDAAINKYFIIKNRPCYFDVQGWLHKNKLLEGGHILGWHYFSNLKGEEWGKLLFKLSIVKIGESAKFNVDF